MPDVFLVLTNGVGYGLGEGTKYESGMRKIKQGRTKGEGEVPTQVFGLYVDQDFLNEAVMLFWGGGWEDRENNDGYSVNNTDQYNITYRGKRRHSYFRIWERGDLFQAAGRNN